MHWLSNSWNNGNPPFKHPCFLYKSSHSHVTISIAHSFQIAATWTFLSGFWCLGWGIWGIFLLIFPLKGAFAINMLTCFFLLFINTHQIVSNAFIIWISFVELFLNIALSCIFPLEPDIPVKKWSCFNWNYELHIYFFCMPSRLLYKFSFL